MGALGVLLDSSLEAAANAMMASLTTRDFVIVSVICLKSCYAVIRYKLYMHIPVLTELCNNNRASK